MPGRRGVAGMRIDSEVTGEHGSRRSSLGDASTKISIFHEEVARIQRIEDVHIVTATLTVKSSHFDDFMQRLRTHVGLSLQEGRCRSFTVSQSPQDPLSLFYLEEYDNKELFDAHLSSDRVKQHIEATSSMLDGAVWFAEWNRISDRW